MSEKRRIAPTVDAGVDELEPRTATPRVEPKTSKPLARPRRRRGWLGKLVLWPLALGLLAALFSAVAVASLAIINPPTSAFMWRAQAEHGDIQQQWVPIEQIAPALQLAAIAAEDQKFPWHWGFDVQAMEDAWNANKAGKRIRGASSITQQTVKNLFLSPSRSYVRKGAEAWLTLCAELFWSKQRTLEIYLNIAQFESNVFGAQAAAQHHFGKSAQQLSESDAAWLAVLLPAPTKYTIQPPTEFTQSRHDWIREQMKQIGYGVIDRL